MGKILGFVESALEVVGTVIGMFAAYVLGGIYRLVKRLFGKKA